MSTENVPLLTRELAERTTVIQVYDGNGLSVLTVAARAALNAIQDGRAVVIDADELAALRRLAQWLIDAYHSDDSFPEPKEIVREAIDAARSKS